MKILMKMKSVVEFQVKNSKITENRGRQSSRFHVFSRLQSIFDKNDIVVFKFRALFFTTPLNGRFLNSV